MTYRALDRIADASHDGEREIPPNGGSSFKKRITDRIEIDCARRTLRLSLQHRMPRVEQRVVDDHNRNFINGKIMMKIRQRNERAH